MMAESIKTIRWEPGDTFIRPDDNWGDRIVPVIWVCMCLFGGAVIFSGPWVSQALINQGPFAAALWFPFVLWLTVFALFCAWSAWSVWGVTRISISSNELVVRHYVGGEAIFTAAPIKLSAVRDVVMTKYEGTFKGGRKWYHWMLIVHLDDGSVHEVAKFANGSEADAFMGRLHFLERSDTNGIRHDLVH